MDQVKVYLALLKKYHFWPLAVLVLLFSTYGWFKGKAAFDSEAQKNMGQIKSTISSVEQLNTPNFPNGSFKEEMDKINVEQKKSTTAAWEILYKRQAEILTWPEQVKAIADLPAGAEIPPKLLDTFNNYFDVNFPQLFEQIKPLRNIKAAPMPDAGQPAVGVGGPPGAAATTPAPDERKVEGIVDWPEDQRKKLVDRYRWPDRPRTMQVRLAQEDYWIYDALMKIIAKTNQDINATDNASAAIKRIDLLAITQEAADEPVIKLAAGASDGQQGGPPSKIKIPDTKATDEDLLNGRYLSGGAAPAGDGGGAPAAAGSEFKLIPVRMVLLVDQRRIPDLLVNLANSLLPVEVRQVRINPGDSNRKIAGIGGRGAGGGGGGGGGQAGGQGGGGQTAVSSDAHLYDATLEIRGVIYLFNPPVKGDEPPPEEAPVEEGQ